MGASRWIVVVLLGACGGNHDSLPDAATLPDAAIDAPPPPRMFGIDTSPAPGEAYGDALAVTRGAGATFIPQAVDWSSIEAGPDDTFAHASIDTHKWDLTGTSFVADATARVLRHHTTAASDGDHLRARYTLDGALSAEVDTTIAATDGMEATLLVRFGTHGTGNTCSAATDEFVALVLTRNAGSTALAAATCRDGVFQNDALTASTTTATLRVRRTASALVVEVGPADAPTTVASLALASLPAAFAGVGRVHLFAGNAGGASDATFARERVAGTVQWDVPGDRFVGDPSFDVAAVLELVHGPMHTPLVINLRTINTVATELPSDLQQELDPTTHLVDLSRPAIRARYHEAIDYLLGQLPDVPIVGFSVGNEIDGYLGASATAWAQTATFADDAIGYARSKLPAGTPISITVTAGALRDQADLVARVEQAADVVFVTYYPLDAAFSARDPGVVPADLDVVLAATTKPILFAEAGYPSAPPSASCPLCSGSDAKQAQFYDQMFAAWDAHPARIRGFSVSWLTDAPDSAVADWQTYYRVSDPTFLAFLASLGVRSQTGVPKPAWTSISNAAHARGL